MNRNKPVLAVALLLMAACSEQAPTYSNAQGALEFGKEAQGLRAYEAAREAFRFGLSSAEPEVQKESAEALFFLELDAGEVEAATITFQKLATLTPHSEQELQEWTDAAINAGCTNTAQSIYDYAVQSLPNLGLSWERQRKAIKLMKELGITSGFTRLSDSNCTFDDE